MLAAAKAPTTASVSASVSPLSRLPVVVLQPRSSNFVLIAVLSLALAALAVPLAAFAERLAADAAIRSLVAARPLPMLLAGAGAMVCVGLFVWPLTRLLGTAFQTRTAMIGRGEVMMVERGLFRRRAWWEPLSAYTGTTRRVRTSLSGVRQELLLVHPVCSRTVVLIEAQRLDEVDVARWSELLAVAEIPSRVAVNEADAGRSQTGAGRAERAQAQRLVA